MDTRFGELFGFTTLDVLRASPNKIVLETTVFVSMVERTIKSFSQNWFKGTPSLDGGNDIFLPFSFQPSDPPLVHGANPGAVSNSVWVPKFVV